MEPINPSAPTPTPTASPDGITNQPMPMPEPTPAPALTPAATPAPGTESKFAKGGILGSAFQGVSFTDVGIVAIAACSMFFIIKYYRDRINYVKNEKSQVTKDVEEVKANVMNMLGQNYKKMY
jgi:hypothetical protein